MDRLTSRQHDLLWFTGSLESLSQFRPTVGGSVMERAVFEEVASGPSPLITTICENTDYWIFPLRNKSKAQKFKNVADVDCRILMERGTVAIAGDESTGLTFKIDLRFVLMKLKGHTDINPFIPCMSINKHHHSQIHAGNIQISVERDGNTKKCKDFFILSTERNEASFIVFFSLYPFTFDVDLQCFLHGITDQNTPNCLAGRSFQMQIFHHFVIVCGSQALALMKHIPDLWESPASDEVVWPDPCRSGDDQVINLKFTELRDFLKGKDQIEFASLKELIQDDPKLQKKLINGHPSVEGAQLFLKEAKALRLEHLKNNVRKYLPPQNYYLQGVLDLLPDEGTVHEQLSSLTNSVSADCVVRALGHKFVPYFMEQYTTCDERQTNPPASKKLRKQ
ncbi:hypothetical protein Pelo_5909 [Pelomyxa schiedti]|nr:hypothetical protein Pelo_5909 [Pelomyxa schiedti]